MTSWDRGAKTKTAFWRLEHKKYDRVNIVEKWESEGGDMYKRFVTQESVERDLLKYSAGQVSDDRERLIIAYQQKGAEDTFSIGQPVYDKEYNLMGYMEIIVWGSLDYSERFNGENIPVEHWAIGNPTKYCRVGKQVLTYWQRWEAESCNDCKYKTHSENMSKLHGCNGCGSAKDCECSPDIGDWIRLNCPHWKEADSDGN
ncbi:MAG: hypothetical protein LBH42_08720 [Treponema sp.]|nr:hypothetical protein [Treponema sp.]